MIELQHVTKIFRDQPVLDDVSLCIGPGEFVCITGPSGAGKSTLLSLLVGAQDVSGGSIEVDGVDLRTVPPGGLQLFRRRVGMVFQDYKLLQNRTVAENIAFPLEVIGATDAEITARVTELLGRIGLADRSDAQSWELSGGEKARVAIARAIVHKPLIVLADEPTGNLDPKQAAGVLDLLKEIHAGGTTVILATHDVTMVDALRTRVVALEKGRLMRDSVGGYTKSADPKKSTRHEVFIEDSSDIGEPHPAAHNDAAGKVEVEEADAHKKKRRGPINRKSSHDDSHEMKPEDGKEGTVRKHRKVRITSIHSEG